MVLSIARLRYTEFTTPVSIHKSSVEMLRKIGILDLRRDMTASIMADNMTIRLTENTKDLRAISYNLS